MSQSIFHPQEEEEIDNDGGAHSFEDAHFNGILVQDPQAEPQVQHDQEQQLQQQQHFVAAASMGLDLSEEEDDSLVRRRHCKGSCSAILQFMSTAVC